MSAYKTPSVNWVIVFTLCLIRRASTQPSTPNISPHHIWLTPKWMGGFITIHPSHGGEHSHPGTASHRHFSERRPSCLPCSTISFPSTCFILHTTSTYRVGTDVSRGGEMAQMVKVLGWWPWRRGTNLVTFSCAAIHLLAVYNLQHHQRPVPLIPCLYGVGWRLKIHWVGKSACSVFLLISYIISPPWYNWNNNKQTNPMCQSSWFWNEPGW